MTPMTSSIDLLEINDFLAGSGCDALRAELLEASGGPATVSGAAGAVQPLVRRVRGPRCRRKRAGVSPGF